MDTEEKKKAVIGNKAQDPIVKEAEELKAMEIRLQEHKNLKIQNFVQAYLQLCQEHKLCIKTQYILSSQIIEQDIVQDISRITL